MILAACAREEDSRQPNSEPPPAPPEPQQQTASVEEPSPEVTTPPKPAAALSARAMFASKLWKTSLGMMYSSYLTGSYPREEIPMRAKKIVDDVMSDLDHTIAKVTAIQLMNDDLHTKGEIPNEMLRRMALLEQKLSKGREGVEKSTLQSIAMQLPFVFLPAFFIGSPLVKSQTKNFLKGYAVRTVRWVQRKDLPPAPIVEWRRLWSREFFSEYQIGKPFDAFRKIAIPLALFEWINTERKLIGSEDQVTKEEIEEAVDLTELATDR